MDILVRIRNDMNHSRQLVASLPMDVHTVPTNPTLLQSSFIDPRICSYVHDHFSHGLQYTCQLHSKPIEVSFYGKQRSYPIQSVLTLLHYLMPYSPSSCTKTIKVHIFYTPHQKKMPLVHEVVGAVHLNSGYTQRCTPGSEIVVFRKEEWCKVFIHECFHYFGMDTKLDIPSYNKAIQKLFPIDTEVNLSESYCEVWARLLNCCLISALHHISLEKLIHQERKHSCKQLHHLLQTMGLTYTDLHHATSRYKEETNAFSYLVLAGLWMCYYDTFLHLQSKRKNIYHYTSGNEYVQGIQTLYRKELPYVRPTSSSARMSITPEPTK